MLAVDIGDERVQAFDDVQLSTMAKVFPIVMTSSISVKNSACELLLDYRIGIRGAAARNITGAVPFKNVANCCSEIELLVIHLKF